MNPVKYTNLVKLVADQTGHNVEVTAGVLKFFWQHVRSLLTSPVHPSVTLPNLGTFKIKPVALRKRLERNKQMLERLSQKQTRNLAVPALTHEMSLMESLCTKMNLESMKKQNIKQLLYREPKSGTPDLEKAEPDHRRNKAFSFQT